MSEYAALPVDSAAVVPADAGHPMASKLPKLKLGWDLVRWLSGVRQEIDVRPKRATQENLTSQAASIATTPLAIGNVTQAVWRVSYTVRVTTPGTATGTIQVTVTWTERGVVQTETGTLLNGNLTTTREGRTLIIRTDAGTPISYSTAYTSTGATAMRYSLDVVAEELAADL